MTALSAAGTGGLVLAVAAGGIAIGFIIGFCVDCLAYAWRSRARR